MSGRCCRPRRPTITDRFTIISRFKLMKSDKDRLENELSALANLNRFMFAPPQQPSVMEQPVATPRSKTPPTFTSQTTVLNGEQHKKDHRTKRPFTIESLISDDRPAEGEFPMYFDS